MGCSDERHLHDTSDLLIIPSQSALSYPSTIEFEQIGTRRQIAGRTVLSLDLSTCRSMPYSVSSLMEPIDVRVAPLDSPEVLDRPDSPRVSSRYDDGFSSQGRTCSDLSSRQGVHIALVVLLSKAVTSSSTISNCGVPAKCDRRSGNFTRITLNANPLHSYSLSSPDYPRNNDQDISAYTHKSCPLSVSFLASIFPPQHRPLSDTFARPPQPFHQPDTVIPKTKGPTTTLRHLLLLPTLSPEGRGKAQGQDRAARIQRCQQGALGEQAVKRGPEGELRVFRRVTSRKRRRSGRTQSKRRSAERVLLADEVGEHLY